MRERRVESHPVGCGSPSLFFFNFSIFLEKGADKKKANKENDQFGLEIFVVQKIQ